MFTQMCKKDYLVQCGSTRWNKGEEALAPSPSFTKKKEGNRKYIFYKKNFHAKCFIK